MVTREFEWTADGRTFSVYVESYSTLSSIKTSCMGRSLVMTSASRDNFFSDDSDQALYFNSSTGVKTKEELYAKMRKGYDSPEAIRRVNRAKYSPSTTRVDKLTRVARDVCGQVVDVPSFIMGKPECMFNMKRKRSKSRVMELVVDIGTPHYTSGDEISSVGEAIGTAICALENAGYRIGLTVTAGVCSGKSSNCPMDRINVLVLRVKEPNQELNVAKLLFTLADPAYLRGVLFGWVVKTPGLENSSGLGYPLDAFFRKRSIVHQVDGFLKAVVPRASSALTLDSLVNRLRKNDAETVERFIIASLMDPGAES